MKPRGKHSYCAVFWWCSFFLLWNFYCPQAMPEQTNQQMELSRPARRWEFMSVLGRRAGLLGNESGRFEAWAYPLKILRNFHLNFFIDGQVLPGDSLIRSIIVRPESTTFLYAGDTFSVRETLCVPIDEPAALIKLDIETTQPLELEAAFERDFQLEWPGTMGGSSIDWNPLLHAFVMTEEQAKFKAIVGSPTASEFRQEYQSNYFSSRENSFRLGSIAKGKATKIVVIAASAGDHLQAEHLFHEMETDFTSVFQASEHYYQKYLEDNVQLTLPDPALEQAYNWAQVSMIQGLIENPYLGTGLVAGYRTSGDDQRPGYAWYFGRDALWTSLALNDIGDFSTTRAAIDFLSKYQRKDGKIPHEIAQGASFVPWFSTLPFAYAAADATPLYIIAIKDYVLSSGDLSFAEQHWNDAWKAYQFLLSTYDRHGLAQNVNVGHGWVEGGPLLPVKTEIYQNGLALEAIRSLAILADLLHKNDLSRELTQTFNEKRLILNQLFWIPEKQRYAFALDMQDQKVDVPSVLATVPMWFGLLDPEKTDAMITQLASLDHQTDWGMRILSSEDPRYDPGGYHSGTVWPLFTGWASMGEYRYHRALAAFSNLRTNALLTFDGALGHVTEVLSGNYYQNLATGSPAQLWSSAMVVSPLLEGLLGLDKDAIRHQLVFAPHVPADWTHFSVGNLKIGSSKVDLEYSKSIDRINLKINGTGTSTCDLKFSPAISLRTSVERVYLNGRTIPFRLEKNSNDQHVTVQIPILKTPQILTIRTKNDFGLTEPVELPLLGERSHGVRVLSTTWTPRHDALHVSVAGTAGQHYELGVWNPRQISTVDGADLIPVDESHAKLRFLLPPSSAGRVSQSEISIHFKARGQKGV